MAQCVPMSTEELCMAPVELAQPDEEAQTEARQQAAERKRQRHMKHANCECSTRKRSLCRRGLRGTASALVPGDPTPRCTACGRPSSQWPKAKNILPLDKQQTCGGNWMRMSGRPSLSVRPLIKWTTSHLLTMVLILY